MAGDVQACSYLFPGRATSTVEANRSLHNVEDLSPHSLSQPARSHVEVVRVLESLERLAHPRQMIEKLLTRAIRRSVAAHFVEHVLDAKIFEIALVHLVKTTLTVATLSSYS